MSQAAHDIEQLEITLEHAKFLVDRAKMAERLSNNRDFKKLIMEGYLQNEASRLGLLISDPTVTQQPLVKEAVMNDLLGVGAFKRFMQNVFLLGRNAAYEMEQTNQTLEQVRAEEEGVDPEDYDEEEDDDGEGAGE